MTIICIGKDEMLELEVAISRGESGYRFQCKLPQTWDAKSISEATCKTQRPEMRQKKKKAAKSVLHASVSPPLRLNSFAKHMDSH